VWGQDMKFSVLYLFMLFVFLSFQGCSLESDIQFEGDEITDNIDVPDEDENDKSDVELEEKPDEEPDEELDEQPDEQPGEQSDEESDEEEGDLLEGKMNFYFGNLHSHSAVSDGKGTPAEVMDWAKKHENVDFYAMTDHAEQIQSYEWDAIKFQTDLANEDGVFVALRGFEWSHPVNGHICVYETDDYTAAYNDLWINKIYDWIHENNGIAQFNHPGREIEHFNSLKLDPKVLSNMFAMETGNKGTGNNDGEFISYFIKALDNGWQIAPTSNQDNHKLQMNSHRTVYIGEELTRDHLLEAMRSRRLYSSDDPDIKIVFKVDEHWMGSHVFAEDNNVRFSVKVMDNEPVLRLELVTNSGVVAAEMEPGEEEDPMNILWFPEVFVTQNSYFFLKVTSKDIYDDENNEIQVALTAPIWIYR
jgi:predicted metal-dependent phosphoesterase TrpH